MKKMYIEYLESIFPMDSAQTSNKPLDTTHTLDKEKEDDDDEDEDPKKLGVKSFVNTQSGNF